MRICFCGRTVDLPDPLFRQLQALAACRGTSLESVIRAAVENEIRKAQSKTRRRVNSGCSPPANPAVSI
jgi:hypothetical protein